MHDLMKTMEILRRGTVEIISEEDLKKKLAKGRPLRVKAGFDPTSADLHLGHTVLIQKMKQFQDLGHQVIFLIGDYTAMIGDPSGRNETRPTLTQEEISQNVRTYEDQVFKILDRKKTEVVRNSEWLGKMSGTDLIRLSARRTVARMLERDDFEKRYKANIPISIHEFLYPLLQGQDSVALRSDVELGGTDQKFNLLMGRELQRDEGQESQVVMTLPLLVGTDGIQKMSKSYGNSIGIDLSPFDMLGKLMSLSDDLMWSYYDLLSDKSSEEIREIKAGVLEERLHPRTVKMNLAKEIVCRFHGDESSRRAADEFDRVFQRRELPENMPQKTLPEEEGALSLVAVLAETGLAPSRSEARRLLEQGSVTVDGQRISSRDATIIPKGKHVLKVGKKKYLELVFRL